jgi:hypothetical protein
MLEQTHLNKTERTVNDSIVSSTDYGPILVSQLEPFKASPWVEVQD